uniref:G_PROTEIN_RECEP_F1_2 domain-containing protein n=1 Tax=Heterorhabditis bacteriophora TaxID=37862 RepID=A0A1I7XB25_HETBA
MSICNETAKVFTTEPESISMLAPYMVSSAYILTVMVGVFGNIWVVCSIARSRKPRSLLSHSSPSDRLRAYISVLAIVDLTVLMALLVRGLYLSLPHLMLDANSCRAMFILEHSVKLASLTVLSCISIERYITIRKPFCSQVRKRFIRLTPLAALLLLTAVVATVFAQVPSVSVSSDGLNCIRSYRGRLIPRLGSYLTAVVFLANLTTISVNYGQIVRHTPVLPVVAHSRARESLVNEPRYMREMTSAIIRVGVFHVVSWLPFCLLQFLPDSAIVSELTASIRMFDNFKDFSYLRWVVFIANWLTHANAAGDWIFYAAMNRDLRNLIRMYPDNLH